MYQILKDLSRRNCPKARTRPECFPFQSIACLRSCHWRGFRGYKYTHFQ